MGDTSVDINRKTLVNIRDNWKLEAKLEDGRIVDGRLENLQRFYDMGVRLITNVI